MASIFLSYAREDLAKARRLAAILEQRGHSVWWDRQIRGGARFAGAIEDALRNADYVVVLWSKNSIGSAWVCDEASEGRDANRLVPVLLENVRPPIGFRQFHCVDLSRWKTKEQGDALDELSAALGSKAGSRPVGEGSFARWRRLLTRPIVIAAAAAVLIAALIGTAILVRSPAEASEPTIAVIPFTDLSPEHNKAYLADGMSEAILTMLAREPHISVIGRTSAEQFRGHSEDLTRMRKAFGVTHVLEGSAQPVGDQLRLSVRLVDASTGKEVWAEDYRRQLTNIFALQDEIGESVAQKLMGTFAKNSPISARTAADIYDLYLAGRSKMRDRTIGGIQQALELAKQVIAADPNYGPGHALYADAVVLLSDNSYGTVPAQQALQVAVGQANRAIQLAPKNAEGYAALGAAWAQIDGRRAIPPLEKALALDPSRAELRLWLAAAQNDVGQNREALANLQRAVDVDPLLRPAIWRLVVVYAASGQYDQAEQVIDKYLERGGAAGWATYNRGEMARYRGDLARSIALYRSALASYPDSRQVRLSLARSYHDLGMFGETKALSASEKPLVQAYLANSADAANLARSAPASLWFGDDLDTAVEILADRQDWQGLVRLYDEPAALRDRACRIPLAAIRFAVALQKSGRAADANRLIACTKQAMAVQQQGPYRNEFLSDGTLHAATAQLAALEGNAAVAFAELDRAIGAGFRSPSGSGLRYLPAFGLFQAQPQYAAFERRLAAAIQQERDKVAS